MAILTEIDLIKKVNKKGIVVFPLTEENITGIGIDLCIGCLKPITEINKFGEDANVYKIPPRSFFLIMTKEFIWLSNKYAGTLHSRGTYAARGIYTNSTNVDPNFRGQMIMSMINISNKTIELEKNKPFITLIIHKVNSRSKITIEEVDIRKSTRVLEQLLTETYTDLTRDAEQRQSLNDLLLFSNSSDNKLVETNFQLKVKKSIPVFISPFLKEKMANNFISKLVKNIYKAEISDNIIKFALIIGILFEIFFIYQMIIDKTNRFDNLKSFLACGVAIYVLFKEYIKNRTNAKK